MSSARPRLLISASEPLLDTSKLEALRSVFDVIVVDEPSRVARRGVDLVLGRTEAAPPSRTGTVVDCLGDGAGEINGSGEAVWLNARLAGMSHDARRRFIDGCLEGIRQFNAGAELESESLHPKTFSFNANGNAYELLVSPASASSSRPLRIETVVGVLWDITAGRKVEETIDALDLAGAELLRFDPEAIASMNVGARLKLLEQKIVAAVKGILRFDAFEVRLVDRKTNRLELVISAGIPPLPIGEFLHAAAEGQGISGWVATTGQSVLCPDVAKDNRYRSGLPGARSSITVPLVLHDRVVGVFNAESTRPEAFNEADMRYAELFGRYIAMAMNILDLLVVERYTSNQQLSDNVLGELREPIEAIAARATSLRETYVGDSQMRQAVDQILESVAAIRARLHTCTSGPRTILGAEQALQDHSRDPLLEGRRVLVADDEPLIRQTILAVLSQRGADVVVCTTGDSAIAALAESATSGRRFDLVVSDVRMPDRNGYEVFRASKEVSPEAPVILMTGFGYDPNHSIVRATQEGLHCFLFKPFQVSQLLEEVRKALSSSEQRVPG